MPIKAKRPSGAEKQACRSHTAVISIALHFEFLPYFVFCRCFRIHPVQCADVDAALYCPQEPSSSSLQVFTACLSIWPLVSLRFIRRCFLLNTSK
jgi:hypothetical protein